MVGKLKHAWPDKGGDSGSRPAPSTPGRSGGASGKLNANSSPFDGVSSASNTPIKSPAKKGSSSPKSTPATTPSKTVTPPSKLKVKVKITEGSFKPKVESDKGVAQAFASGELIVEGGDVSLKSVAENLQKTHFLDKLVLQSCGVDDGFVVKTLSKHLGEISYIDLSKNDLSEDAQMKLITAALTDDKIEILKLTSNAKIGKSNCDKIGDLMEENHSTRELEAEFAEKSAQMEECLERNREVFSFSERIREANSSLDMVTRRISVRDNDLVATMIKAEENNPSIKNITINQDPRFGHIQNTIVVSFAEGMRANLHVKTLKMTGLDLGNVFLSGLAASIETNFTLEEVDLSNNAFTSDGMSEFCQAMALNESIQKVNLKSQHSPVFSHSEEIVVNALQKNHFVKEFFIEFKTPSCGDQLKQIIERNQKEGKTIDYDKKLIEFLAKEALVVEEMAEQRKLEAKPLDIPDDDWEYFYQLEQLANQYKCKVIKEAGAGTESGDEAEPNERQTMKNKLKSARRRPSRSMSDAGGISKKINMTATQFTGDGEFLTEEFISQYITDNPIDKSVTFDFSCQFKMFKRFPIECPDRSSIVKKFADVLLAHPRAPELTHINMSNCFLGNDWLVYFCDQCLSNPKHLPKLHMFNLETNFISEPGVIALSKNIASLGVWKYLQAIKLENQKFLLSSKAEHELAKALFVNRGVITVNLRVRNIHERTRIEKYVYRNTDLLRQARRKHKIKTGTLKERKRNNIEQYFDKIAADDPSITEVELVGDQLFNALNKSERLKAAKAFATNTHVTQVKMSLLKLDDEFGAEIGKSMETNSAIESLNLENNMFSGDGIKGVVGALAKNSNITELQLRHQGKNMASSDESQLAALMGDNKTLVKFGVELRHMQAKNDVERKIRANQDLARKNRRKTPGRTRSTEESIKKVGTWKICEKVIKNDATITAVTMNYDREFINLEGFRKKEFFEGLKKNTVVKSLTMTDLQMDNSFADVLISILKVNSTIESIVIDRNWFTSLGVYTMADAVIKSKSVRKFSIQKPRAKISSDEAERLLEAMEKESHLHEFKIDFREKEQTDRLMNILVRNKSRS